MARFDGSLALKLDFGATTPRRLAARFELGSSRRHLQLAPPAPAEREKYIRFERRRRQAQIAARHLLDVAGEN